MVCLLFQVILVDFICFGNGSTDGSGEEEELRLSKQIEMSRRLVYGWREPCQDLHLEEGVESSLVGKEMV